MKLLLLHGFSGRGVSWLEVIRHLHRIFPQPDRLQIEAPDLPGHGELSRVDDLPADFDATLDALAHRHLPPADDADVHVVGYSLGGRLALGLAVRYRPLLASLTLIGARPGMDDTDRESRASKDSQSADELRRDLESFVARWQEQSIFDSQKWLTDDVLERQRQIRLSHDRQGLAWALETLSPGRMPDWRPSLRSLDLPVNLVVGELDKTYVKLANEMALVLPRAHLHRVPDAGHNVPMEKPAAVAKLLAGLAPATAHASQTAGHTHARQQAGETLS